VNEIACLWKVNLGSNRKKGLLTKSVTAIMFDSGREESSYVAMTAIPGRVSDEFMVLRNNPSKENKIYID